MPSYGVYGMADGTFRDAWGNPVEDPNLPLGEAVPKALEDMTAQELKDEAKARQDAGRTLDLSGVKSKADLIAALKADDAAPQED